MTYPAAPTSPGAPEPGGPPPPARSRTPWIVGGLVAVIVVAVVVTAAVVLASRKDDTSTTVVAPVPLVSSTTTTAPSTTTTAPTTTAAPPSTTAAPPTTPPVTPAPGDDPNLRRTPRYYGVNPEDTLPIHTGPSVGSPVVGQIPRGATIPVYCAVIGEPVDGKWRANDPYWLYTAYNNAVGWVTDEYVITKTDVDNRSIIPFC